MGTRPSEMMGVTDPLTAFNFDKNTFAYGRIVDALLDEYVEKKERRGKQDVTVRYPKYKKLKDALRVADRRILGKTSGGSRVAMDLARLFSSDVKGFDA